MVLQERRFKLFYTREIDSAIKFPDLIKVLHVFTCEDGFLLKRLLYLFFPGVRHMWKQKNQIAIRNAFEEA